VPITVKGEEEKVAAEVAVLAFDAPQSGREGGAADVRGSVDAGAAGPDSEGNVVTLYPGACLSGGESARWRQGKAVGIEQDDVFAHGASLRWDSVPAPRRSHDPGGSP
jgi:hypothetical protein